MVKALGMRNRYRGETNRTDQASALLSEIEDWCARTGTPEAVIGHILWMHPGFVGLLRKRLQLTPEKEKMGRGFMAEHPNGWRGVLPQIHYGRERPIFRMRRSDGERDQELMERPRVNRDPCPRCGCRGDIPCSHSRVRLGMVL